MSPTTTSTRSEGTLEDDPLLARLADLPAVPVDPIAAEALRRSARAELLERATPRPLFARLSLVWGHVGLPALLGASGAAYTWSSIQLMGRIFLS